MVTKIIKYSLARNGILYQWLDFEGDEEAQRFVSYVESTGKDEKRPNFIKATNTTTSVPTSTYSVLEHTKTENDNSVPSVESTVESTAASSSLSYSSAVESSPFSSSLRLPIVIFPDGTHMEAPSCPELAEKIGLKTHAEMPFYDLIIGGGPAGKHL